MMHSIQTPRITNDYLMDSVSEIRFGNNDIFATGAWDGYIRFYQILSQTGIQTQIALDFKNGIDCQEPVLSISWKRDMTMIFAALADNTVRVYDIKTGQNIVLGYHDDCPARQVFWNDELQVLVSLGFDKKLRLWSLKQNTMGMKPSPVYELNLTSIPTVGEQDQNERMFAYADVDSKIKWFSWDKIRGNLNSAVSRNIFEVEDSKLGIKSQISTLSISHNSKQMGYCSVDGRGAVMEMTDRLEAINRIVYKCHKREEDSKTSFKTEKISTYYVVNSLQFNSRSYDWVSTSSSDSTIIFWDLKKKNKITTIPFDAPVIASQVSPDGYFLAYATGYDWGQGLDGIENRFSNNVGAIFIDKQQLFYV
ncbi:unnamed protein product [Paramecium pentaurelia]|uniref:WD40 repeat-like protein n=1 Tax=Paramecium pentaurelia TaxID=43138 RepID=A0A8S1SXA3_9CILI|nr:unnamed protein product [Paramecium pentaurelia]